MVNLKRVAILTGGGDAPGLNAVIESCTRVLLKKGIEVVGVVDGFEGIFSGKVLNVKEKLLGLHSSAGTLLGTSNKSRIEGREAEFLSGFKKLGVDGLIACGGDGTFAALKALKGQIPVIGVPKTIDNDIAGTDVSVGFDTACAVVADSADSLRFTAEAHSRIFVIEAMGRRSGWIALGAALASQADAVLIPERPFQREELLKFVASQKGERRGLILIVAEGASAKGESATVAFREEKSPDPVRFGGVAFSLARWLEEELDWEARHVILGHLQRSQAPTTADRFLSVSLGVEAARLALEGGWGQCLVYRQGIVQRGQIADLMAPPKLVPSDHRWVAEAQALGIFI